MLPLLSMSIPCRRVQQWIPSPAVTDCSWPEFVTRCHCPCLVFRVPISRHPATDVQSGRVLLGAEGRRWPRRAQSRALWLQSPSCPHSPCAGLCPAPSLNAGERTQGRRAELVIARGLQQSGNSPGAENTKKETRIGNLCPGQFKN